MQLMQICCQILGLKKADVTFSWNTLQNVAWPRMGHHQAIPVDPDMYDFAVYSLPNGYNVQGLQNPKGCCWPVPFRTQTLVVWPCSFGRFIISLIDEYDFTPTMGQFNSLFICRSVSSWIFCLTNLGCKFGSQDLVWQKVQEPLTSY